MSDLQDLFNIPSSTQQPAIKQKIEHFVLKNSDITVQLQLVSHHDLWGHCLWNAAKTTSDWLVRHPEYYVGKNVLELGAAAALPSLTVAIAKDASETAASAAKFVCATDYPDNLLIQNIEENFNLNSQLIFPSITSYHIGGYLWGSPTLPLLQVIPENGKNGENPTVLYDLIILSDVIFNHSEQRKLLKTCRECLSPDGLVFVSFTPHRPHLLEKDLEFFRLASSAEFSFNVNQLESIRCGPMFPNDVSDLETRSFVHQYTLSLE